MRLENIHLRQQWLAIPTTIITDNWWFYASGIILHYFASRNTTCIYILYTKDSSVNTNHHAVYEHHLPAVCCGAYQTICTTF